MGSATSFKTCFWKIPAEPVKLEPYFKEVRIIDNTA